MTTMSKKEIKQFVANLPDKPPSRESIRAWLDGEADLPRIHQSKPRGPEMTRVQYGENAHHSLFARIKTDEVLYRTGLLRADEVHADCDLGFIPSTLQLCRDLLKMGGQAVPPMNEPHAVITRALTSSDFPSLIENLASKAVTLGYTRAPEIWPLIVKQTTTPNFQEFSRVTVAEIPTPPEVGESLELTHAPLGGDFAEKASVAAHAQLIGVSRESLISGELDKVAINFAAAGTAVSRAVGNAVLGILSGNPVLDQDATALFDATHGNVGTAAAPSAAAMDEVFSLMGAQTGPSGEVLNIRPRYIVAAPGKASTLAILRAAMVAGDPDDQSTGKITTLTDARLSGTAWFSLADPDTHSGIEVVTPEGGDLLRFERKRKVLERDGLYFVVGADFVAVPVDYRALATNAGA